MMINRDMYVYADNADGYHAILIDAGNNVVGAVSMWGREAARDGLAALLEQSDWADVLNYWRADVKDAEAADELYDELSEWTYNGTGGARELTAADVDNLINDND